MITIGCDEAVIPGHTGLHTCSNGLLTISQMAEAANLALLVELIGEDLHAAHRGHLEEKITELVLGDGAL